MIKIDGLEIPLKDGSVKLSLTIPSKSIVLLVDHIGIDVSVLFNKLVEGINVEYRGGGYLVYTRELYLMGYNRFIDEYLKALNKKPSYRRDRYNQWFLKLLSILEETDNVNIVLDDPLPYMSRSIWPEYFTLLDNLRSNGRSILIYTTFNPKTYMDNVRIDNVYNLIHREGLVKGTIRPEYRVDAVVFIIKTSNIGEVVNTEGIRGYLELGYNMYMVFIDRRFYHVFRRRLVELYYEGDIDGFKHIVEGLIEFG